MDKSYDYLIVGAGLFGATFAHEATLRGKHCLVIDRRKHTGGNIYCKSVAGINVHVYGAHIFHTSDKRIWTYVNQFAEFNRYTNSPIANFNGEIYNLPFNMNTFNKLWGVVTPVEAQARISAQRMAAGTIFEKGPGDTHGRLTADNNNNASLVYTYLYNADNPAATLQFDSITARKKACVFLGCNISAESYVTETDGSFETWADAGKLGATPTAWWIGAVNDEWNEAGNWSTGAVPGSNDVVVVEGNPYITPCRRWNSFHPIPSSKCWAWAMAGGSRSTRRSTRRTTGGLSPSQTSVLRLAVGCGTTRIPERRRAV